MYCVRSGQVGLGLDLGSVDDLVQARRTRVGCSIDHVDVVGTHAGDQQVFARHGPVVVARRTGVPPHVVQFVPDARHLKAVYDLTVGRAIRVSVNCREVVGLLDACPCVDGNRVQQFFPRRFDRFLWACIAWSAACSIHHLTPPLILLEISYYENTIIV